jgi:hypothetical protein
MIEPTAELVLDVWEARFPFVETTSDPLAQELDNAHELFLKGIQLAKSDLSLARLHIVSAFLRDPSVLMVHDQEFLRHQHRMYQLHRPGTDDERKLDFDTLQTMRFECRCSDDSKAWSVLSMIFVSLILILSIDSKLALSQSEYCISMEYLDYMLKSTDEYLETSILGELGGLTRAKLLLLRGRLFKKMSNGRSAIKD